MKAFIAIAAVLGVLAVAVTFGISGCGTDPSLSKEIDTSSFTKAAVPEHVKSLKSREANTRREAALALWQIGAFAPEAAPLLLETIHDSDPKVREAALRALARTGQGEKKAVAAIVPFLKDTDAEVRARAAASLAELGAQAREQADAVVPSLDTALRDPVVAVRVEAAS